MNYTIVIPIHNEAAMLPQTLPSIFTMNPTEIIFGLDRCSDKSEKIILHTAELFDYHRRGTLILRHYGEVDGAGWGFRSAYLRRELYAMSHNDVILNTSADIILDPAILKYLSLVPEHGLVSFGYLEKNIQSYLRILISSTSPIHGFAGLLAFSKTAWERTEDLEDLKKIPHGEDDHLHQAIMSRYPTNHINTRSLHLRPNESKEDNYNRGEDMYNQLHRPQVTAFLHSLIMIRPAVLTGWRHARNEAKVAGRCLILLPMFPLIFIACLDDTTEEYE